MKDFDKFKREFLWCLQKINHHPTGRDTPTDSSDFESELRSLSWLDDDPPPGGPWAPPMSAELPQAGSEQQAELGQQAEPRPEALPASPLQQAESAVTNTAVLVRERKTRTAPQQVRAHRVLTPLYPDGVPTAEEVPDVDLLEEFFRKYDEMIETGQLRRSRLGKPSASTVLRAAGRKELD